MTYPGDYIFGGGGVTPVQGIQSAYSKPLQQGRLSRPTHWVINEMFEGDTVYFSIKSLSVSHLWNMPRNVFL